MRTALFLPKVRFLKHSAVVPLSPLHAAKIIMTITDMAPLSLPLLLAATFSHGRVIMAGTLSVPKTLSVSRQALTSLRKKSLIHRAQAIALTSPTGLSKPQMPVLQSLMFQLPMQTRLISFLASTTRQAKGHTLFGLVAIALSTYYRTPIPMVYQMML